MQDSRLKFRRHGKIAEYHQEHEQVVNAERFFYDISGKVLQCLSFPSVNGYRGRRAAQGLSRTRTTERFCRHSMGLFVHELQVNEQHSHDYQTENQPKHNVSSHKSPQNFRIFAARVIRSGRFSCSSSFKQNRMNRASFLCSGFPLKSILRIRSVCFTASRTRTANDSTSGSKEFERVAHIFAEIR